jgi:hypothetical protein
MGSRRSAPRQCGPRSRRDDRGLPAAVLDFPRAYRADPVAVADGPARDRSERVAICRQRIRAARPVERRLFLRRLAFSRGARARAEETPAGDDDADFGCHQRSVFLLVLSRPWSAGRDVFLGAGDPDRHHAARALDRDEIGDGRVQRPEGAGRTAPHAGASPVARRLDRRRPCDGDPSRRSSTGEARRKSPDRRADRRRAYQFERVHADRRIEAGAAQGG